MTENPEKDKILISKLTEIILANLGNENFGVKELSVASALSHKMLKRKLSAITNKTISQFIREVRLRKAMEMLHNETTTASEVAYKVGFGSPSYFNTCFHELFGYPPGAVQKEEYKIDGEIKTVSVSLESINSRSAMRTVIYALSAFLTIAAIFYIGYRFFFKTDSSDSAISFSNKGKSIAVLPFKNLSDDTSNQYFIDGLMEEILTDLSSIHDLRVISRTSTEQFRDSKMTTSEIAKKLNVQYIVEGSGQKYGNSFGLRVQLIEASSEKHIWAESFGQEITETEDIFKIQSLIAQTIAHELKANITPQEKMLIEKIPTISLTAYDFYREARMKWLEFHILSMILI